MTEIAATANSRVLLDRHEERAALERVLANARSGTGGSLVLRGETGIGRTSLLEYTIGHVQDMRVARLAGIEAELGLGFAALHRLLTPMVSALDRLPGPQRDALSAAFGLIAADPPDRFMVSLGVLALLTDMAADQPLLVAVDDAQWLDQATTEVLAFVARRMTTEPIVLVIAVREPTNRCQPFDGLPDIHLTGLPDRNAHELLAAVATGPLDGRTAQRIVTETGGNPLALVEFGRQLIDGQPAAGVRVPQPLPIGGRLKGQCLRWVRTLPSGTQTLLLLAAAEPSGSPVLLRRAAERLGLGPDVGRPAEAAGLLTNADQVTFRHALTRSAVYHGASPRERRRIHAVLAAVTDPVADPDGHAWHLASAAGGPDEQVAGELVRSAERARAKADHATEAMLLTRAADLTPDENRRAERLLDGAAAELRAGAPARAENLLDRAEPALTGPRARTRAAQLRARAGLARGRFAEAPSALLRAARRLHPAEPAQARRTLLDAMYAGLVAGAPAGTATLLDIIGTVRRWPAPPQPPTAEDLLLDAFITRLTAGHRAAVPVLRDAVERLTGAPPLPDPSPGLLAMGAWAAGELLDSGAQRALASRRTSDTGDVTVPDPAGVPGRADLLALAWRGRESEARSAIAEHLRNAIDHGAALGVLTAQYATVILELGLGRYGEALGSALKVYRDDPPYLGTHVLPDLIEAAVRTGNLSAARSALERLAERALASGTALAAGLLARSRALLAGSTGAECLYLEAVDHLRKAGETAQEARAHLLYGEWLRRQRRRRDAREELRVAREMFDAMGFEAFAQRSRGELLATGERASKRTGEATEQLTPQEMQVARLVAEGGSNRQVAAQLFISSNTVEYHLQKVFRKVGVSSRTQLARALLDQSAGTANFVPGNAAPLSRCGGCGNYIKAGGTFQMAAVHIA